MGSRNPLIDKDIIQKSSTLDQGKGKFFLASVQPYFDAQHLQEKGLSIFTYYLIEGLKGNPKSVDTDGKVTLSVLSKFIYEKMSNLPPDKRPKTKPIMKASAGDDIILAHYPALSKSAKLEINVNTNISSLIDRGNEYFADGNYIEAIKHYNTALSMDPYSAKLWTRKARAVNYLGDQDEAIHSCQRALELDPSYVNAKSLYNEIYTSLVQKFHVTNDNDYLHQLTKLTKYYSTSHAIIIGISEYSDESAVPNAYNDALCIQNILKEKYGFSKIISLFNKEATKQNIEEVIVDMIQDQNNISPNDRVLIYFAGHGKLKINFDYYGNESKEGYIIPYDAKKGKYSSYIEMRQLIKCCQGCMAKHILLILDCCYSGFALMRGPKREETKKSTDQYLEEITSDRAIQVLAAGEEDQPVSDSGIRIGNSAFTGALLDILESQTDIDEDGIITAREIGLELSKVVSRHVIGTPQRPLFGDISGSRYGEFIFKILKISQ